MKQCPHCATKMECITDTKGKVFDTNDLVEFKCNNHICGYLYSLPYHKCEPYLNQKDDDNIIPL